jgi:O-antigen/teichoic acid export membrane protein
MNNTPDPDPVETELGPISRGLTGTVVRGAGVAGLGYGLTQALTLGFFLALARLATPADFGEFAAAAILVNAGGLFTESGMMAALIHRRDRIDEAASTAAISTVLGGLAFGLVALAASPLIGAFFDSDRVATLAAASSGLILVRSIRIVPEALLQRRFSFWRRMLIEPAQVIGFGIAAVIAAANGLGPWALVIGYYAGAVIDSALSWALLTWRPKFRLASWAMWRELVAYGRHVLASNVLLRLGEQVPTLLLGRFVSKGALGQYRYADRMASTPFALVLAGASYVVLPAFARISDDRERLRSAFQQSLRWFSVVAVPLGLIFVPLGVPIAVLVFGETWRNAGEAAIALGPFVAGASFSSLAAETFKADGETRFLTRVNSITAVASTLAMLALLSFDLVGIAAGITIGTWVGALYALWLVRGLLGISLGEMAREILPAMLAGAAMIAVTLPLALLVDPTDHRTLVGLLLLAAEGLVAFATYGVVLRLSAPDTFRRVRHMIGAARQTGGPGAGTTG